MGNLVVLVVFGGISLTGLLAYLAHLRAETRRAAVAALRDEATALSRDNTQLRELITALRLDAARHARQEPLLANQVENRITTHPLFHEQLAKELEP
jgi:N-formylglutamate amidohydrolase